MLRHSARPLPTVPVRLQSLLQRTAWGSGRSNGSNKATTTDYGKKQRNELEALESIYPDSFTGRCLSATPA
ncbi:hypothetical protein PAL_GLEAN10025518 [Pteropus alecto]|uniref:Uncharacterized protein n=1 Tax=Pteropus alecto TaxID=9402 RepID=L5JNR8_PTEAL|nr:hypothetical protein PAL_GLEAN10025518 [Pteropus alecto]